MLNFHDTCDLEGKVPSSLLGMYKMDYRNLILASIIAGFHRSYGLRNEGIAISMEIINSIKDTTENLQEKNVLVWNLYVLSIETIDDNMYDDAMKIIDRAEKNWSRDLLLGDDIGVYHVSWLEQIWLKKAEIYLFVNDDDNFESITDKILYNRLSFFSKAEKATGETVIHDKCAYSCLELMALQKRRKDIKTALSIIKKALLYKGGGEVYMDANFKAAEEYEKKGMLYKAFQMYCENFYKMQDYSFDNIGYGYCRTCRHYNGKDTCLIRNILTNGNRACTQYSN